MIFWESTLSFSATLQRVNNFLCKMSETSMNDEIHMTTPELIAKHGYVAEIHHVWTEDGYRLELHRITQRAQDNSSSEKEINGNKLPDFSDVDPEISELLLQKKTENLSTKSKYPILLNHGLLSSSADFVLLGPQKALAYLLCDCRFDVWLANVRGNAYSKAHKKYTVKDKEFWDFSWHEVGYYDLPAMIDYILTKTHHSKLYYIGYSQGTTTFYAMASERPEYNEKIKGMISLAPVAFLANQQSPLIKLIVRLYVFMEWGSEYCNIHQWFPRNRLQSLALSTLVRNTPGTVTKNVYTCWLYLVAGFGSNQLDKSMLPLIFGHFPAGSSARQIIHFGQNVLSDSFRKFDYGVTKNLEIYGSTRAPKYCLERVNVPVAIFYSENDSFTHPKDVERLVKRLPNVVVKHKIEYAKFNHIDYIWGRDARTLLYRHVINTLKQL